jgi:hypothetical protein
MDYGVGYGSAAAISGMALAEVLPEVSADYFFGRGGLGNPKGIFNRGDRFRVGWGWKGSRDAGREVFRIARGKAGTPGHTHWDLWEADW